MELKFKAGDKAIIADHPNRELIGRVVEIKKAFKPAEQEGDSYEMEGLYYICLEPKDIGWVCESDLKAFIPSTFPAGCADGVYILTMENNCIRPGEWLNYQDQTPVCIAVVEGDRKYGIALKSSPEELQYLPSREIATSNQYEDFDQAKEDWNGKANTAQLVAAGSPAAKYCDEYSCGNIPAGTWYLSALGEKIFLQKHKNMIDAALTICGGDPLFYGWHETSTEQSASSSWLLNWYDGDTSSNYKSNYSQVRPICAFL